MLRELSKEELVVVSANMNKFTTVLVDMIRMQYGIGMASVSTLGISERFGIDVETVEDRIEAAIEEFFSRALTKPHLSLVAAASNRRLHVMHPILN